MRTLLTCTLLAPLFVLFAACGKKQDDTPPPGTATTATAYPGYPPPQPTYGQPQPYPNQYPPPGPTYAQPGPAPAPAPAPGTVPAAPNTTAAPAGTGQMAVPGPIAFQCQNDVPCGTHHCNVQYGKCAFPCQSAADCIPPNQCSMGLCIPLPQQGH